MSLQRSFIVLSQIFEHRLQLFEEEGIGSFRDLWLKRALPVGTTFRALQGQEEIFGSACGIGEEGALILKENSGKLRALSAAHIIDWDLPDAVSC